MAPRLTDIVIGLNAVVIAVTAGEPRVLTVRRITHSLGRATANEAIEALPFGPFDPAGHRTLELGLRAWVGEQTDLSLGYVEQLYTFADLGREGGISGGDGARVVSIGYLALAREAKPAGQGEAQWMDWYRYFPWEDWRRGRPPVLAEAILPGLAAWARSAGEAEERRRRDERIRTTFGEAPARWDEERVLERYELLYEAELVGEARRDRGLPPADQPALGQPMVFDHRRILATAMSRLRGKLKYRPVVFELLPPTFTLLRLQQTVEALAGMGLHKQNFRRLVEQGGLVEGIGEMERGTGGRPAEKFRFRRDVLVERPAPGMRLPMVRGSSAKRA